LQSNVEKESVFEPSPEILTVTSEEFKPSSQTYHTDTSSEPEKSNTEEDKDSLWRWLVISLLFLLLLVGLSLKGCSYVNVIVATNQQNSEQQLRNEIKELWTKIQEKSDSCTLAEAKKQKIELPQIPITPPVEPVEQEKKQGSEFPIPPQPTIAPLNEEALEKKDISVFSGAWLMTSDNLFDSNTDEKIKIAFIFDNVGNGKSGVIKNGGSRCISDSTVVIDSDKQFSISPLKLSCDDGHSITLAGENGNPLPCKLNGTDKAICYIECGTNNDLTVCPTDFARENI
jgi:hypothetical protein